MAARVAAVGWSDLQGVVVVDMALRARRGDVRTGQCEACNTVVERRHVGPGNRVMALGAIGRAKRRPSGGVNRIIGLLPGGQVATGISAIVWLRS